MFSILCIPVDGQPANPDLARIPAHITVKPVFVVPRDASDPPAVNSERLMHHLKWCQSRYRELLFNTDTFQIEPGSPFILHSKSSIAEYRACRDMGAGKVLAEMLESDHVDRYNCPYIYLFLFHGTGGWPVGGGRTINGGINTGGGIVVVSDGALGESSNFQSTLQHELGHTFGLPHVNAYHYSMKTNASVMSYNPDHHTHGFTSGKTSGVFIPEDYRVLALNTRAFPNIRIDPCWIHPYKYKLYPQPVLFGAMKISGQPDYVGPSILPSARAR